MNVTINMVGIYIGKKKRYYDGITTLSREGKSPKKWPYSPTKDHDHDLRIDCLRRVINTARFIRGEKTELHYFRPMDYVLFILLLS